MEEGIPGHGSLSVLAKFEYKFTRFAIGIAIFLASLSTISNSLPWYTAISKVSPIFLIAGVIFLKALFFRIWLEEVDFLGLAFSLLLQGITVIGFMLVLSSWLYANSATLPPPSENQYPPDPSISDYNDTRYLWRRVVCVTIIYGMYSSISFFLLGKFLRTVYVSKHSSTCEMPHINKDEKVHELDPRMVETD